MAPSLSAAWGCRLRRRASQNRGLRKFVPHVRSRPPFTAREPDGRTSFMTSATRHTNLESVSPDHAMLLFVDQQEGLFTQIHESQQTRASLIALARSARLLGVPAVMTTALAAGSNGP